MAHRMEAVPDCDDGFEPEERWYKGPKPAKASPAKKAAAALGRPTAAIAKVGKPHKKVKAPVWVVDQQRKRGLSRKANAKAGREAASAPAPVAHGASPYVASKRNPFDALGAESPNDAKATASLEAAAEAKVAEAKVAEVAAAPVVAKVRSPLIEAKENAPTPIARRTRAAKNFLSKTLSDVVAAVSPRLQKLASSTGFNGNKDEPAAEVTRPSRLRA